MTYKYFVSYAVSGINGVRKTGYGNGVVNPDHKIKGFEDIQEWQNDLKEHAGLDENYALTIINYQEIPQD